MSSPRVVAPIRAEHPSRGSDESMRMTAPGEGMLEVGLRASCYVERAMLLWPRLDGAKVRRVSDDPAAIAEIVKRRTSQPYDVILAMLTQRAETA